VRDTEDLHAGRSAGQLRTIGQPRLGVTVLRAVSCAFNMQYSVGSWRMATLSISAGSMVPRAAGRTVVKTVAAALDHVHAPASGVVVLAYHRVGGSSGLELDLDERVFSRQVQLLQDHGVMSLDDGLEALSERGLNGTNSVVVTFDDGTADFADVAFPILADHRIPVTVYVATRFIEERVPFRGGGAPVSWAALRDCLTTGLLTVGSHTHSHALLDRLPAGQITDELDRSIDLIGDRLGVGPRHFAYPRSVAGSRDAEVAVRVRFSSAALGGMRANPYGSADPYHLKRSPIQASDGMRWFNRKLAGGMVAEDVLRRFVNRWRYADATT